MTTLLPWTDAKQPAGRSRPRLREANLELRQVFDRLTSPSARPKASRGRGRRTLPGAALYVGEQLTAQEVQARCANLFDHWLDQNLLTDGSLAVHIGRSRPQPPPRAPVGPTSIQLARLDRLAEIFLSAVPVVAASKRATRNRIVALRDKVAEDMACRVLGISRGTFLRGRRLGRTWPLEEYIRIERIDYVRRR